MAERIAKLFNLTAEDVAEGLPSGGQTKVENRVNWALYDLYRAGLLNRPVKGRYSIAEAGRKVLSDPPEKIDRHFLSQFPGFEKFATTRRTVTSSTSTVASLESERDVTPDEQIDQSLGELNETLVAELSSQIARMDPYKFEELVVDLLSAMGYGGSKAEAARVTKKSGDQGIDGVINEDRLGLDVIYIQAKRWQAPVGRREIQSFVGALAGQQAHKGIFITTSTFGDNAVNYAASVAQKIILIDGARLASLMIEYNVGVSVVRTLNIKKVDSDYFEDA
jgi:restriction system protein